MRLPSDRKGLKSSDLFATACARDRPLARLRFTAHASNMGQARTRRNGHEVLLSAGPHAACYLSGKVPPKDESCSVAGCGLAAMPRTRQIAL